MSDLPKVFTVEPLVPISNNEVASCAALPYWTLTEALFFLSGHRSPGYESARHRVDHFLSAHEMATRAIEIGEICRKIERVGKTIYVDRPARWLAWADSIGPKYIKVDERVRRALSPGTGHAHSRKAGGESKDEAVGANALGRPSLKTEIEKACNELIANEKAILDSRKSNYEPIRQIIRRERDLPSKACINGLGDEAIRKVIAPILNEAKAASHKLSQKL